jgi:GMP synthase-like glutamine amidotransferase
VRVLTLRHVPFEGLGRIAPELESSGIGFDYADLYQPGATLPGLDDYSGLIVLGGPMSANDADPWIGAEIGLIRQAIARDFAILGICLGAQLLAKALGAEVLRNPEKEIGWFDLEFTPAAANDALFAGIGPRETVFHWHGETFSLAPGAVLLAASERCRHQAVRYGQKIYALQFHLEVTPEMISDWVLQDENCGDVRELAAPIAPNRNGRRLDGVASTVFGRWRKILRLSSGTR